MARRLQAALTALTFVVAGVFSLVHEATTAHVRCGEHGELTHVDPGVHTTATHGETPVAEGQPPASTHAHEHCMFQGAAHSVPPQPAPAITAIPVATDHLAIADLPAVAARDALYRIAPKTSPPV